MPSLSPTRASLRPSVFADLQVHLNAHAARGGDLIGLHLGDTYLEPPQAALLGPVLERQTDTNALYRYGAVSGLSSFKNAIAEDVRKRGRALPNATGDNILLGAGATHALFCAAAAVLSPGDEVLLAAPYWPLAHGILLAAGAKPVEVPFTSRLYEDPTLDAASVLSAALTPETRALYLISPNNPDGKMLTAENLASLARFAVEEDLWVFADEAYADFSFGPAHLSIASLPGMAERTITAYSFSKSHALAGLRVGYVVVPPEVLSVALRVSTHSIFNVPLTMQHAAAGALAGGSRWGERALLLYRRSLDAVIEGLAGTKVRFHRPDGGAYLFLDFREVLGDRPLSVLLERAIARGVLLAPGVGFGLDYAGYARLCFTSEPLPRVVEGVARLVTAIKELG